MHADARKLLWDARKAAERVHNAIEAQLKIIDEAFRQLPRGGRSGFS
jgi:hypothetical protein